MPFLIAPFAAGAFSECASARKGVCIRLDPSAITETQTVRGSSLLLAEAGTPFPGLEFLNGFGIGFDTDIGAMLSALYNFGVAIAGISALIMVTFGGVIYLTAEGSGRISTAKKYIYDAIFGLVIIATSYLVLYTINPDFSFTLQLKDLHQFSPAANTNTSAPAVEPPAPEPIPI